MPQVDSLIEALIEAGVISRLRFRPERLFTEPLDIAFDPPYPLNPIPVVLVGRNVTARTQTLDAIIGTDGRLLTRGLAEGAGAVVQGTAALGTTEPADNTDADVTFTSTQVWEPTLILRSAQVDATVATRTFVGRIVYPAGVLKADDAGLTTFTDTGSISLTASQEGAFYTDPQKAAKDTENTNGSPTLGTTHGFPSRPPPGTIARASLSVNKQTGDRTMCAVFGRVVA